MALVDEWVAKAEGDYKMAVIANRPRKEPQPDGVCYHCQQSAEKYLKAYLVAQGVTPPKTHDLEDLLSLCTGYDTTLTRYLLLVQILDPYSTQFRYPGASATITNAKDALKTLRRLRRAFRRKLGL